jgi:nitrogen regulatory protein P-II 1
MKKIEAVIRLTKLDAVVDALVRLGVAGMTLTQVRGSGRQQGHCELYRGSVSAVHLVTKVKIEMLVLDAWVEKVLKVLQTTARTGGLGMARFLSNRWTRWSRFVQENAGSERSAHL